MYKKFAKCLPWQLSCCKTNKFVVGLLNLKTKWLHWVGISNISLIFGKSGIDLSANKPVFVPHNPQQTPCSQNNKKHKIHDSVEHFQTYQDTSWTRKIFSNTLLGYSWEKKVSHKTNQKKKNTKEKKHKIKKILSNHITPTLRNTSPSFIKICLCSSKINRLFFSPNKSKNNQPFLNCFPFILTDWAKSFLIVQEHQLIIRPISEILQDFCCCCCLNWTWMLCQNISIGKSGWRFKLDSQNLNNLYFQNDGMKVQKNTTHDTENHFRWQRVKSEAIWGWIASQRVDHKRWCLLC